MTDEFLNALEDDVGGDPILVAGPASAAAIGRIEAFAGYPLPPQYRAFLERFGAAIVGPYSVFGVGAPEAMSQDEASVVSVTQHFRADGWPGTQNSLVVSMDHAGNAITLDSQGIISRFDHDTGTTEMLARSFGEFVKKSLTRS